MNKGAAFFDTNVLLYLLSADERKANRAEEVVGAGGVVSIQVLNEFAAVASRKLRMPWPEVRESLSIVRAACRVEPLTVETHELALDLVERHAVAWYDALIAAAALIAGCVTLYSEDFQHGLRVDGRVEIVNPFH